MNKNLEDMTIQELNQRLDSIVKELGFSCRADFYIKLREYKGMDPRYLTGYALRYILENPKEQ